MNETEELPIIDVTVQVLDEKAVQRLHKLRSVVFRQLTARHWVGCGCGNCMRAVAETQP